MERKIDVRIRELEEKDIEELAGIESEAFSMPWSKHDFEELLRQPYCRYLVALVNGRIAGGCGYTESLGEATIDNVVVAEAYRGMGIAQAMLRELILRGESEGVGAFTLEVRVSNTIAIHIYEKNGFKSEGIRPGFYEKPREDAMIMWRRGTIVQ
jgi:ribosomal-protein-alanine N-acetyltransferase